MANQSMDSTAGRAGFSAMRLLPIAAGIVLVALILWVQFGAPFGQNGFFVNIGLGIVFYFCYAWYERIAVADEAGRTGSESKN